MNPNNKISAWNLFNSQEIDTRILLKTIEITQKSNSKMKIQLKLEKLQHETTKVWSSKNPLIIKAKSCMKIRNISEVTWKIRSMIALTYLRSRNISEIISNNQLNGSGNQKYR